VIAAEQSFDLVDSTLGELSDELLPVAVFDLEESHEVVCLEQHQANEASVELLVALYLVLELTANVPIQLLFVHWQGQSFDHRGEILRKG